MTAPAFIYTSEPWAAPAFGRPIFAPAFKRERMSAGHLPQSSSASRFTADASEFFILSQSGERPERKKIAPALPIVGRAIISIVVLGGVVTPVVGVNVGIAERALRPLEIGAPIRKAEESLWHGFVEVDARNVS